MTLTRTRSTRPGDLRDRMAIDWEDMELVPLLGGRFRTVFRRSDGKYVANGSRREVWDKTAAGWVRLA